MIGDSVVGRRVDEGRNGLAVTGQEVVAASSFGFGDTTVSLTALPGVFRSVGRTSVEDSAGPRWTD